MYMNDWPYAHREVHLLGGIYAINDPEKKDKVFLYPNCIDGSKAVITIPEFKKLYGGIRKINLDPIIGVDFYWNEDQVEGICPPEWRAVTSISGQQWAHTDLGWRWGRISNQAYKEELGHLWDISKRIERQISTLSDTYRSLSLAYRNQLHSKVESGFEVGGKFENGYSSYIYNAFQHFLFDACMLRDYLSEFIFHYVVPSHIKDDITHMAITSKVFQKFYKGYEVETELDIYYKNICEDGGWLNILGCYRDLVMHACPLSMPKQRAWIRCETIAIGNNKQLPRIIAPIPKNPAVIKNDRNSFKYFKDFKAQANDFFGKSNNKDESIDLLEYSSEVMSEFSVFLRLAVERSPVEGITMVFDRRNIVGR